MALQTLRIRLWPFRKAPARLKAIFDEGRDTDWVAIVPDSITSVIEPYFLRLRQLHPVSSVRLPDGSAVYWGAPRESIALVQTQHPLPSAAPPPDKERRIGVRVPLECAMWYETGSPAHHRRGQGRVLNMSSTGVAFTTESLLRRNTRVALHVQWPLRLEADVPVELFASGKIVRAEPSRAALAFDQISFRLL